MTGQKKKKETIERKKQEIQATKNAASLQDKWVKWSAIATVIIALATVLYLVSTVIIIQQMASDNELQREYYQKTVRPFVFIKRVYYDFGIDSAWKIICDVVNEGAQPAKSVWGFYDAKPELIKGFKDEDFQVSDYDFKTHPADTTGLFRDQVIPITFNMGKISIEDVRKLKFIHLIIYFSDIGGKEYSYKEIRSLEEIQALTEKKLAFKTKVIWVDFK